MYAMYALGERQTPGEPEERHAVENGIPGTWGTSVCSRSTRVWVHVIAGSVIPFNLLAAGVACPECLAVVEAAQVGDKQRAQETRHWAPKLSWRLRKLD
ncbi:hypothetical protein AB0K12_23805 [Nonomuraea sp. NPDC049419]|uniref:hypothetical protein n=1 Tax=Nonomuraea sp. NPDC049419 TaxID=3155772 RepID=UPI0034269496